MTRFPRRTQLRHPPAYTSILSRREFIARSSQCAAGGSLLVALCALSACTRSPVAETREPEISLKPKIKRIRMATIAAVDLETIEDWYGAWLGYAVVERGEISAALAASWGAPDVAGRPYILMRSASGADVFIRAVKNEGVAGYRPMTTFGWNSIEIIVDDVYALHEKLQRGPFEIIGPPAGLTSTSTIHAMQVIGPSREVLYLTCETGRRDTSFLPAPGAFVGRPFILVLAGLSVSSLQEFYVSRFSLRARPETRMTIGILARALDLPETHQFPLGFVPLGEAGHAIELDAYPAAAGARSRVPGQLPPGNAIGSFAVASLRELDIDFISPPVQEQSLAYRGRRSAAFIGPAGEITELIEEP